MLTATNFYSFLQYFTKFYKNAVNLASKLCQKGKKFDIFRIILKFSKFHINFFNKIIEILFKLNIKTCQNKKIVIE